MPQPVAAHVDPALVLEERHEEGLAVHHASVPEVLVVQQILEQRDQLDLCPDASRATGIEFVEGPRLLVHELIKHVRTVVEGGIHVEEHKAELAVIAVAEGLHVVAGPVAAAVEELDGHVVGKLVDV